jgi:hypothetical protein
MPEPHHSNAPATIYADCWAAPLVAIRRSQIRSDAVPVARNGLPVGRTIIEGIDAVGEVQMKRSIRRPVDTNIVVAVAVPIPGDGNVATAAVAGEHNIRSLIVDAQKIFQQLLFSDPEALHRLTRSCISIAFDGQIAVDVPIFAPLADGSIRVRYNSGGIVASWALPAVAQFHRMVEDAQNATCIRLEQGHILIRDNRRTLHSYTPTGKGVHRLRRAWLLDKVASVECHVGDSKARSVLDTFNRYGEVTIHPDSPSFPTRLGVRLPPAYQYLTKLIPDRNLPLSHGGNEVAPTANELLQGW